MGRAALDAPGSVEDLADNVIRDGRARRSRQPDADVIGKQPGHEMLPAIEARGAGARDDESRRLGAKGYDGFTRDPRVEAGRAPERLGTRRSSTS